VLEPPGQKKNHGAPSIVEKKNEEEGEKEERKEKNLPLF